MKSRFMPIVAFFVVLNLVFCLSGCGNKTIDVDIDDTVSVSSEPVVEYINPLTGLSGLDPEAVNNRPVAVMVNNIKTAQSVQTGLDKADIVYETYAEGGITRLLAVYKDITKASNIGTVRSARYSYVDLAMGHDAIYVHAGINESHALPHIKELGYDNYNMLNGGPDQSAFRVSNGKSYEHTLYTSGENLVKGFEKLKWRTELKKESANWQSFVKEDSPIVPSGGSCIEAVVTMSNQYVSRFKYDNETKRYLKYNGTSSHKDYRSGEQLSFKNVLVLKTEITSLDSKNYLQKTVLNGGNGYYISEGGYIEIKWSKGSASNPLKITLADGSDCSFNAGNTWVCLMNKNNSVKLTGETPVSSTATQSN